MYIFLETPRLEIRTTKLEDADDIQKFFGNWEIIKWLSPPVPWPYKKDSAKDHIKNTIPDIGKSVFLFSIILKKSNKVIGTIRYKLEKDDNIEYAERGFALDQNLWSKGIMMEASLETNKFIFENTNIQEICSYNATENIASKKIQEKQGFTLKEINKAIPQYHGGYKTEETWILTRDRYNSLNKPN